MLSRRFSTLIGTRWALIAIVIFAQMLVAYYFTATASLGDEWNSLGSMLLRAKGGEVHTLSNRQGKTTESWLRRPELIRSDSISSAGRRQINGELDNEQLRHDFSPTTGNCLTTQQGLLYLVDSNGSKCHRQHVLADTNCCSSEHVLSHRSCDDCDQELQCCESFEQCVSCCLGQTDSQLLSASNSNAQDRLPSDILDALHNTTTDAASHYGTLLRFDTCLHLCRTSSRTINHGNMYKYRYKHCYSEKHVDPPIDLQNAKIVTAQQGVSCSETCEHLSDEVLLTVGKKAVQQQQDDNLLTNNIQPVRYQQQTLPGDYICWELYLPSINSCEMLQQYFSCSGGCIRSAGADQPAMVDDGGSSISSAHHGTDSQAKDRVNEHMRGMCLVNNDATLFHCDGRHADTKRLCPCVTRSFASSYI